MPIPGGMLALPGEALEPSPGDRPPGCPGLAFLTSRASHFLTRARYTA